MPRASHIAIAGGLFLLAVAALALTLALSFDWNRAKPWLQQKVAQASGRSFSIDGELSLAWRPAQGENGWRAWMPWPRLDAQQVALGNVSWSGRQTMARARRIAFSLNPLAALQKRIVIPAVEIDGLELALERDAGGKTNWSFPAGEQNWKLEVDRVIIEGAVVDFRDAAHAVQLRAAAQGTGAGQRLDWRFSGSIDGEDLHGDGDSSAILPLQDGEFPLRLRLRSGKTSIDADGMLHRSSGKTGIDMQMEMAGDSMARLRGLSGVPLPETAPFSTAGRLLASQEEHGWHWRIDKLSGRVGKTDLAGTLKYRPRRAEARGMLEGSLLSQQLRLSDLAPLLGIDAGAAKGKGSRKNAPRERIFTTRPLRVERLQAIDADIMFKAARTLHALPAEDLETRLRLQSGRLSFAPLTFRLAGGSVQGELHLDGGQKPVQAELKLAARRLELKRMTAAAAQPAGSGEINADAKLRGSGDSFAGLMAGAGGEVKAAINQGSLSKLLLDRMGMNIGGMLVTQMFGDKQVGVHCAVADFVIDKGMVRPRGFFIDTEEAKIYMDGRIDLGQERLDLRLYPESKAWRLVSLRSPLHLSGSFIRPVLEADQGMLAARAGGAIALGAVAPLAAALLPLMEVGTDETNECTRLLNGG